MTALGFRVLIVSTSATDYLQRLVSKMSYIMSSYSAISHNWVAEYTYLLQMSLDPPIKQGQTRYHFLILLFSKDTETTLELTLSE